MLLPLSAVLSRFPAGNTVVGQELPPYMFCSSMKNAKQFCDHETKSNYCNPQLRHIPNTDEEEKYERQRNWICIQNNF